MTTDSPSTSSQAGSPAGTGADGAARRVPRPCGSRGMWRQARSTCGPECFGRHATWPLLRGLGVVPSPLWHTAWYGRLLDTAAERQHQRAPGPAAGRPDQRLAIAAVNPEDHLLPATLTELAAPAAVDLHVVSACATPLAAIQRWATRHGQAVTIHHGTLARRAGPFDLAVVSDDTIPLGMTRAEERPTLQTLVPVVDALAPGAQLAYATRLGPSIAMAHTLEYADFVRFVQSTAGLTWRHHTPSRREVADGRWHQPPSYHVHYESVGIKHVLTAAGLDDIDNVVDIHERPSRPLRWHPDEITLGAGSQIVRFTGAVPGGEPPEPPPTTDDPAVMSAREARR